MSSPENEAKQKAKEALVKAGKANLRDQLPKATATKSLPPQPGPDQGVVKYLEGRLEEQQQRCRYLEEILLRFIQQTIQLNELVALVTGEGNEDQAADNPQAPADERPDS